MALVITIVLLIILSGIMINIGLGENGLFARAKEARNKYLEAEKETVKKMNLYDVAGNVSEWTNESNSRDGYAYMKKETILLVNQ